MNLVLNLELRNRVIALRLSALVATLLVVPAFATAGPITGYATGSLECVSTNPCYSYSASGAIGVSWSGPGNATSTLLAGFPSSGTTAGSRLGENIIDQDYQTQGGLDVDLATIIWDDNDNLGQSNDLVNFAVNWNMTLNFTDPVGQYTSPKSLFITLKNGEKNDTIALSDLSHISFELPGWHVTNLHYMLADPTGGSLAGTSWTSKKDEPDSRLWLVGDFQPTQVPEPSLPLLIGLGIATGVLLAGRWKN